MKFKRHGYIAKMKCIFLAVADSDLKIIPREKKNYSASYYTVGVDISFIIW